MRKLSVKVKRKSSRWAIGDNARNYFIRREKQSLKVYSRVKVWPTFGRLNRPTQTWLGVPMVVQGRAIGMISIQSLEQEYAFDESQVELLSSVANQAAVAIENARLLVEERARAQQLEAFNEIALQITSQLDLDKLLKVILENALGIMAADSVSLFTWDSERQAFDKAIRVGVDGEPSIPSDNGRSAKIAKMQKPVWVRNTDEEESESLPAFVNTRGVRSFAGIPLLYSMRTLGVLYVNYNAPRTFTKQEEELVDLLAKQAAVAIANARLYTELDRERQDLRSRLVKAERFLVASRFAANYIHRVNNLVGTIPIRVGQIEEKFERCARYAVSRYAASTRTSS